MKRILAVMLYALMLCGCADKKEEGHSSTVITAGGEVVSACRDGEDVTEERKALEEQTEEAISRFLNRDIEELEFDMFCMLEEDGMTIEVMVDGGHIRLLAVCRGILLEWGGRMGIGLI